MAITKFEKNRFEDHWVNRSAKNEALQDVDAKRTFPTGANRDTDNGKIDYEGFLSPVVLKRYAEYLDKNRTMKDGSLRDSDNWQKGIPRDAYIKSALRHFMDVWEVHRDPLRANMNTTEFHDHICAVLFNVMGYLFEELRKDKP